MHAASFSVNSGGPEQSSQNGAVFDDDSEKLGAASLYTSSNNKWAVSSSGVYISNSNGPTYTAETDSQITNTLDSELYKTARIAPTSLRYYGLGLQNGVYKVELHFAEVVMDVGDSSSWKGLGRRLFDVYIQGERVLQDFNIAKEAGGSKRALVKTFDANVTNMAMDIHLMWVGKGSCCIPLQSTYGPLISALHVSQGTFLKSHHHHPIPIYIYTIHNIMKLKVSIRSCAVSASQDSDSSKSNGKRVGRTVGIVFGCAAALLIICGAAYLWLAKKESSVKVYTQAPKG